MALWRDPIERFWEKVDKRGEDECWPWKAAKFPAGYGQFRLHKNSCSAHRASYEIAYGPPPAGLVVMHICDNKWCVNPKHLKLGTLKDNSVDMVNKGRNVANCVPQIGESNGNAKLSDLDIKRIRNLYKQTITEFKKKMATEYGLSIVMIKNIVKDKNWKHLL